MAKDISNIASDLNAKMQEVEKLKRRLPSFIAGAVEKMKDANFSAQGFIENGTAKRWKRRKRETPGTRGKRILHSTGTLQNSVKVKVKGNNVVAGIDLSQVPYAKAHNEGGRMVQYVRAHHRRHY